MTYFIRSVINYFDNKVNNEIVNEVEMGNHWDLVKKQVNTEMEAQGITKAELARRLGWPPPQVSRYLGSDDAQEPGLDKIGQIAAVINLSLSELFQKAIENRGKLGLKAIPTTPSRDSLVTRLIELVMKMNLAELQSTTNVIEKAMAKRSARKDPKTDAQAG